MNCTGRLSGCIAVLALLLLYVSSSVAETRICLNMIAKDEAREILSCLNPLAAELSGWTLCDTGSTDNTVQIIEEFFDKKSIPGLAATHQWQDFGHNRNLCIQEGMHWSLQEAKRQGMPVGRHYCDYLLFLDADQLLARPAEMEPGALKAMDLTGDGYHMTEKGVGVTYKNLRLVSTRLDWEWVGEVHEYVRRKDSRHHEQQDIDGLWFNHDASGGQEGKRFVRDEVILAKAVSKRPADTRARFYYANTLRALQRVEEAITQYLLRIKLGGWVEERFMSALNIADLSKKHWEAGKLISSQVQESVSNFDSHDMRLHPDAEEAEEAQIQTARDALKAAKDAAKAKLDAAKADRNSNTGDQGPSGTKDAGKEADGMEVTKHLQEQLMADPGVKQAAKVVEKLVKARQHRQFPLLVSAYTAAITMLPYRPEPWVHLAKLHRMEKGDNQKCHAYAAAGLAQGPARKEALFLNTNHASYELLDEVCACAYYVDSAVDEGRRACTKLRQKLTADLQMSPDNEYLLSMLSRVTGNLSWYDKKAPKEPLDDGECPSAAQARFKHKEAAISTA